MIAAVRRAVPARLPDQPLVWTTVQTGCPQLPEVIQTRIPSRSHPDRRYRITALPTGLRAPLACTCRGYEENGSPWPVCYHMRCAWLDLHRNDKHQEG